MLQNLYDIKDSGSSIIRKRTV